MRAFTGAGGDALGPLFSNAAAYSDTLQRDQLSRVALSVGTSTTDDLDALIADLEAERADLAAKLDEAEALTETIAEAQAATVELTAEYHEQRAAAEAKSGGDRRGRGPSGRRVGSPVRRAMPPPRRPTPPQPWPPAAVADGGNGDTGGGGGGGGGGGDTGGGDGDAPAAPGSGNESPRTAGRRTGQLSRTVVARRHRDRGRPIASWACPTSATQAIRVSDSTARVSRRTRGGRPACTCRTSHAPRRRCVPHVPASAAQPGDLIFYYTPISHVGIYLGGGMLIHAPTTGKSVSVASVHWDKVVVVGRPG